MDNLLLDHEFTGEGAEPVTPAEAKNWLKIDVPDDDTLLTMLIKAARKQCENFLNMSLVPKTVKVVLFIGLDEMPLPYGPVKEVSSVINSENGQPITDYKINGIKFKRIDPVQNITVTYTAGYDDLGLQEPDLKVGVLNEIAYLYENSGGR